MTSSAITEIDIARDVTFHPDVKGPALLVRWRGVGIGYVQPFNRIPRLRASVSPEDRKTFREELKQYLGKWYASFVGGGYFDTKEEAARHLITCTIKTRADAPVIQAAIRGDREEVDRLLREMARQVVVT
jgi:hypothetical protein